MIVPDLSAHKRVWFYSVVVYAEVKWIIGDSGDVNGLFRRCEYGRSAATLAVAMMPEFIHIGQ
jgi:hypothetical protein